VPRSITSPIPISACTAPGGCWPSARHPPFGLHRDSRRRPLRGRVLRRRSQELFVGTKDLVQFYLAADWSNHLVASSYQTRHPAVMAGLSHVVASARRTATPVHG
jgi:hypothetical protein